MPRSGSPEAAAVLRPILPELAAEIIAALREEVPEYDRPLRGPFGAAIRQGVEQALARFADSVEDPSRSRRIGRETYVGLGRGERAAGRSLEALLSAYRTGARIAWRRAVDAGVAAGLDPQELYALGEAIFAYIDELSAESAEGYAEEQSREASERSRRVRAMLRALLAAVPEPTVLAAAAAELGWEPPERLAVVVAPGHLTGRLAARAEPRDLVGELDDEAVCVVADPRAPALVERLERAAGSSAVLGLGPEVTLAGARTSWRRARAAQALGAARPELGRVVLAEDHLAELLLRRDPELAADVAARMLGPLGDLAPGSAAKLTATLRAWLDEQGRIEAVARVLDVHPQTVRYRLGQLREHLGDALDDPDGRFALALALRADLPAERPPGAVSGR